MDRSSQPTDPHGLPPQPGPYPRPPTGVVPPPPGPPLPVPPPPGPPPPGWQPYGGGPQPPRWQPSGAQPPVWQPHAGAPPGWGAPVTNGVGTAAPLPSPPRPGSEPAGRPPQVPPGRRAGWVLLAVFLVAEFVFVAASILVVLPFATGSEDSDPPAVGLALALVVPTVAAALVTLLGSRLLGAGPRLELRMYWNWVDVAVGLGLGVGGVLLLTIPASLLWASAVGPDQANSAVGEVFGDQQMSPVLAVAVFLAIWLVAPLCEELLYRGVLWSAFERWRWNRWLIFGVTTVVFSVAHLELLRTPLLIVISIPIGLARVLTGNTVASIVAHQVNNFLPAMGLLLVLLGVDPTAG